MSEGRLKLFRAVRPEELASIQRLGRFTNPPGLVTKYFTTSRAAAEAFARMAQAAFHDGPYTIVGSSIAADVIGWMNRTEVDGGIAAIVLPTQYLTQLEGPDIEGPVDETA